MPPEVTAAMVAASKSFVDLNELQKRVGERIARITRNEACYVSSGAAAGLTLATAAVIVGNDPAKIAQLPDLTGLKDEVIILKAHRNGYDHAVRQVGVKVIEVGTSEGSTLQELEQAITAQTAAIFWFQGAMNVPGEIPLPEMIQLAKAHAIPVIVDAAAQLPPVSNLWAFTEIGADIVVFSGGKDLRGPQSSGLVLGRKDIIEACAVNGSPNHSIGRPMKVGKEEMVGLLIAVERYLKLDHEALANHFESVVADWNVALNAIPGITSVRDYPNEAGQPAPRTLFTLDASFTGASRDDVVRQLLDGNPSIVVATKGTDSIYLNPMTLEPGEEDIILKRPHEIFRNAR